MLIQRPAGSGIEEGNAEESVTERIVGYAGNAGVVVTGRNPARATQHGRGSCRHNSEWLDSRRTSQL